MDNERKRMVTYAVVDRRRDYLNNILWQPKKDSGSIFEKVTSTGLSGESYKSVS